MYVFTVGAGSSQNSRFRALQVMEVPNEYFDPGCMTRLGTSLTTAQLAALIPWSTTCPGWPFPINPS